MNCKRCRGTGEEPDQKKIGRLYRKKRVAAGISLRLMGRLVNRSHGFLSQLESGHRTWTFALMFLYTDITMNKEKYL